MTDPWKDIRDHIIDDSDWLQKNDGWADPRGRLARCDDERRALLGDADGLLLVKDRAALRRAVIIHDNPDFVGRWVAVPKQDFDALREALAALPEYLKGE